jgi:hypothetical protein
MLGTFSKFIDRANLQTAFVSGMKEELELFGNVSFSLHSSLLLFLFIPWTLTWHCTAVLYVLDWY